MDKKLQLLRTLEAIFNGSLKIDELRTGSQPNEASLELIVGEDVICFTVDDSSDPDWGGLFYTVKNVPEGDLILKKEAVV